MKKILVPIDFSPAARFGFEYAEWLSLPFSSQLIAVHVAPQPSYEGIVSEPFITRYKKEKREAIKKHLKSFTTAYPNYDDEALTAIKNIHCQTKFGGVIEEIVKISEEETVDLIVLGTRKKHSILDHLFGSVSTKLITKSKIPILIVPEGISFHNIKKIAFATAITGTEKPVFQYLDRLSPIKI